MLWQDFDLDGKIKVPLGFNLVLFYLLRGYLFWVVSLTLSENRSLILSVIYPEQRLFLLTLLVGIPAVICFFLFSLKSQTGKIWYKTVWQCMHGLLTVALVADLSLQTWTLVFHSVDIYPMQVIQFILGSYLTWYWLQSKRVKRFFKHWVAP